MTEKNHSLGSGKLYLDRYAPGTQNPTGEFFLGNCPEFNINITSEELAHMQSTGGVKEEDDSATLSVERTASIVCDNVIKENLALAFLGSSSTLTQSSATGEVDTFTSVKQGHEYQLGTSATSPSGVRAVSNVVVTDGAATTPTTYVLNTDYTVDAALGRVAIVKGGGISDLSQIEVTYDVAASSRELVLSGNETFEGALRFLAYNRKGKDRDYFMAYVRVTPNGDLALIGDDWAQIPLSVKVLKKGDLAAVYAEGRALIS